jgi:protein-disulfide isomerase
MSKQFWIALAVIVAILGGIVVVTNHNNNSSGHTTGTATSHTEGSTSSGVTLVEYGDYECPICGDFFTTVKQVAALYNSQIIFQFRNLPLTSIHQNAFASARAAEAAGLEGKFWQMHDLLYENQNAWAGSSNPQTFFDSYAAQLGLSTTTFDQDYSSPQVNNAINADVTAFNKTGDEMATPTFYLDGTKLDNTKLIDTSGRPSVSAFQKLIDAEIAKKAAAKH